MNPFLPLEIFQGNSPNEDNVTNQIHATIIENLEEMMDIEIVIDEAFDEVIHQIRKRIQIEEGEGT